METFEYNEGCSQPEPEWPSFYPEDITLPPTDSIDTDGIFFRLVVTDPPQENCFLTTHEEQPERHMQFRKRQDLTGLQNVYGMSFFNEEAGAIGARDRFPDALGHRLVAKGGLEPFMGKMRQYPNNSSHFTMWIRNLLSPYRAFTVIEESS